MIPKTEILIYNLVKKEIPSQRFFQKLVEKSLVVLGEKKKVNLSLIFIDAQDSKRLNNYWRNKNIVASVLSFPFHQSFPVKIKEKEKVLGDIFLCPEKIENQAREFKILLPSFYTKIVIHSLLHLYGYTHEKEKDSKKMERLENKILRFINNK
ncbi:MAG: rRNA maturation RNase YbeY [Candidatus Pacebacteria bacterium]|jgi:probable rRNA maturation factor|nr:rRNA maturation RNase YbeY [Candidatus Paceibacterota bacterium]MDD4994377.1 rRNA maturation RNase YbeY [Candidatus Paceibacterota bacterium]MDD5535082.1 rRNA maturation RNase YbeY [Candidatus Paceibacterota bacterium]